jgi:hypothetical protein
MNRYKMMLGTIRSYLMLAKCANSQVYRKQAKNTLARLKTMLNDEKTRTMEFKW